MGESEMPATAGQRQLQDQFSAQLRRLRVDAGNPSFRVMAATSRSVSHTTLHEAAQGARFPSWPTAQAFVEACGGDVEEWRARWSAAAVPPASSPATATATATAVALDGTETETETVEGIGQQGRPYPAPRQRRRVIALAAGAGVLLAAVATAYLLLSIARSPTSGPTTAGAVVPPSPTAPMTPGDISAFIEDVTIPDGTVVKTGQHFMKTWEIANAGSVPWHDRFLERAALPADNGTCMTPGKVPIPDTEPGATVQISVPVTAPSMRGSCWVGWKMVDGQGRPFLPGARPLYFVVNVAP